MAHTFALIHSPLVGPTTWMPVSNELRRSGHRAVVPGLHDDDVSPQPYWKQEVDAVISQLEALRNVTSLVLVAHSGAGALLPSIAAGLSHPVEVSIYVDAGLPLDGASRLDEMADSSPEFASTLQEELAAGGRAPIWTDDDLRAVIPDDGLRRAVLAELNPRPLAFYEEPIENPRWWAEQPCGYVLFSPTYAVPAQRAHALGWHVQKIPGDHFHMLVDPRAVAVALVDIADSV